jgi:diguanylate cyclase (GGDEF)-like protein
MRQATTSGRSPDSASGTVAHDPSRISRLERKKRPIAIASVCFFVIFGIALIGTEAWSRLNARESQLEESKVATVNIAAATAEHAERSIDLITSILFGVVERVEQDGLSEAAIPRLHRLLTARVEHTPALQGLFVYDEHGRWIVNSLQQPVSGANNSDRSYFIYHQGHADRAVHIGEPIQSRSSGVWVLPVSRRLEHRDGSFAGVALATVRISYFQRYYDSFDIGRRGAIFLALSDGTVVTRRPFKAGVIGTSIKNGPVFTLLEAGSDSGTAMRVSKLDGVERLYTYRRLKSYPLVIAAALSKEEIFDTWWVNTYRECAGLAILLLILLLVGYRLFRQVLIRDRLEHELRGAQLALEISNRELERLSRTDALTGLSNRRHLNEQLETEIARAAREGSSVALVMLDIDFFKRYNDTYGHLEGDQCLRIVSQAIAEQCGRRGDIAARFGGEEFAILMPNTDANGALAVAARVCNAVLALGQAHIGSPIGRVTVSAGACAFVPAGIHDVGKLVEAADNGLYLAKSSGRNQAKLAERLSCQPVLTVVPRTACAGHTGG